MSMVQAGAATDAVIDEILPHLDAGDILIDGGNANFRDTQRRHDAAGRAAASTSSASGSPAARRVR